MRNKSLKILQKIVFLQKSSGKFKKKRFDIEKYTFFFDKIGVTRLGLGTAKKYYEREKMKKILSVSIMAMLAVSPMMAHAVTPLSQQPVTNPTHTNSNNYDTTANSGPQYAAVEINQEDQTGVASAAYVKGAYNEAIRAVNKVAAMATATADGLDTAITNKINAAGGAGIAASNGKVSIDLATSNSGLAFDGEGDAGKLKVAITTNNVASGSLATGDQANAENTKLATQGYVDKAEASAKTYADGLASNYDAAGSAATAEQNAKDYADGLASNYDAAGSADAAETAAKGYTDTQLTSYSTTTQMNTAITNAVNAATATVTVPLFKAWGDTAATTQGAPTFSGTVAAAQP